MTDAAPEVETIAPVQVAPLEGEHAVTDQAGAALEPSQSDLFTKDEFFQFFAGSFTAIANVMGAMRPPKLISLEKAGELSTARPASDALYDMALLMPWLRWLIAKDMAWLQGGVIIFAFGAQLTGAVQAELALRKGEQREEPEREEAA